MKRGTIAISVDHGKSKIMNRVLPVDYLDAKEEFSYVEPSEEGKKEVRFPYLYGKPSEIIFYTGLVEKVASFFEHRGYTVKLYECRRSIRKWSREQRKAEVKELEGFFGAEVRSGAKFWKWQRKAIWTALPRRHGTIVVATGAGKTHVAGALAKAWGGRTVILVPGINLMEQTAEEIGRWFPGERIGMMGGGVKKPGRITVGVVNTMVRNYRIMREADNVIADEAHYYAADMFRKCVTGCRPRRLIGFTATYFRNLQRENIILYSTMGPVIIRRTPSKLLAEGVSCISRPKILLVRVPAKHGYSGSLAWETVVRDYLIRNKARNEITAAFAVKHAVEDGLKFFIFVERIRHGEVLLKMLKDEFEMGPQVEFVSRGSGQRNIKRALEALRDGRIKILIATRILGVGVNVPSVGGGCQAAGEGSPVAALQKLGRTLRGGGEVLWCDIIDEEPEELRKSSGRRRGAYLSEEEFDVREMWEDEFREEYGLGPAPRPGQIWTE